MKVCPQCQSEHEDYMSFCMKDGTPLVDPNAPTETKTEAFVLEDDAASQTADSESEELQSVTPISPTEMKTEEMSLDEPEFQTQQVSEFEPDAEEDLEQETVVRTAAGTAGTIGEAEDFGEEETGQTPIPPGQHQEVRSAVPQKSNTGLIIGGLLIAGLLFFGVAVGGGLWWYLSSGSGDEIAAANANDNSANDDDANTEGESSNDNSSDLFGDNSDTNTNEDKSPTPTKSPSPTPTKSPSPTPTKSPSPTPTPDDKTTPTPDDKKTPTPDDKKTPTPTPQTPKTIAGGVVNGKARSLPKPAYPASARAVGAKGRVNVRVLIDESGNVVSATAVSGHPLLQGPAAAAARRARFNPTRLNGQPVKVSGIITYNFQ